MESPAGSSAPSVDLASLAKLWPNRTHESNWMKDAICALGFHRWYPLEVSTSQAKINCNFCRWCSEVKVLNTGTPIETTRN
jgi:hypothetical protein